MMRRKFMSILSVCLYAVALLLFMAAITVTGGGSLLDFSGLAQVIFCCLSMICVIAATVLLKTPDTSNKKKIAVMVVLILVIAAGGFLDSMYEKPATEYVSIVFPFELEAVDNVEMYHYMDTSVSVEKKTVTDAQKINYLYTSFEEILVQEKVTEEVSGASVTSFRFNLTDGTCYELIYVGNGIKDGILKSPTTGLVYFTSADIGWNWSQLDSELEAVPVDESELPVMDSGLTRAKNER